MKNKIAYNGKSPDIHRTVYVAEGAIIIGRVTMGSGSSIWFNSVVRGDCDRITIGSGTNIQDNCTLHVDEGFPLTVGDRVTVGHNCVLHGCSIGNDVLIGMGSVIMNGAVVGEGSVVAAGSLLPGGIEVPPGHLAMGSPARVKRALAPEEIKQNLTAAKHYEKLAVFYLKFQ